MRDLEEVPEEDRAAVLLHALVLKDEARASELLNMQRVESRNQIALALVKGSQESPREHNAFVALT